MAGLFPVDLGQGTVQLSTVVDTEFEVVGENAGKRIQVSTKSVETKEVRFTYR